MRTGHAPADRTPDQPRHRLTAAGPDVPGNVTRLLGRWTQDVLAAAARCGAPDDEAIHDLRVAARRMEAALQLWRPLLPGRARRKARARLRRWRRRLSAVRDLEVMAEALSAPDAPVTPEESQHVAALRARLERRRDRARQRAVDALTPARLTRLERRLGAALPDPAAAAHGAGALAKALEHYTLQEEGARSALAFAWSTTADDVLHAARLTIKKQRYAGEALAAVAEAPLSAASASARALQQALGAVQDRSQLRDCLLRGAARAAARRNVAGSRALAAVAARVERSRLEAIERFRSLREPSPPATG